MHIYWLQTNKGWTFDRWWLLIIHCRRHDGMFQGQNSEEYHVNLRRATKATGKERMFHHLCSRRCLPRNHPATPRDTKRQRAAWPRRTLHLQPVYHERPSEGWRHGWGSWTRGLQTHIQGHVEVDSWPANHVSWRGRQISCFLSKRNVTRKAIHHVAVFEYDPGLDWPAKDIVFLNLSAKKPVILCPAPKTQSGFTKALKTWTQT